MLAVISQPILCFASLEEENASKNLPVIVLNKDNVNNLGEMKVGDLLLLIKNKLPVSFEDKSYEKVIKLINNSNLKEIEFSNNLIIVTLYENTEKANNLPTNKIYYVFKDGLLVNGPIVEYINNKTNSNGVENDTNHNK
jgi:hypothetical protein